MKKIENYTLFYCAEDGKMHAGTCREEKEALVDVKVGGVVEIEGYRGDGLTLTLTGLEFETTADMALVVPENTTIVLESGVSRLTVHPQGPEANVAVLYVKGDLTITGGEGRLCCDASGTNADNSLFSRGICVRYGDLTVTGGQLDVTCGLCKRKPGALYAGGHLYGGDQQKGAITITGGTIVGFSTPNMLRATENQLTLGPGSRLENSAEFSGSEEAWHGSAIFHADLTKPVVISFES